MSSYAKIAKFIFEHPGYLERITQNENAVKHLPQVWATRERTPEVKKEYMQIAIQILNKREVLDIIKSSEESLQILQAIAENYLDPQYIANNFVFPPGLTLSELFEAYATKLLETLKIYAKLEEDAEDIKVAIQILAERASLNTIQHARHPLDRLYIIAQNHLDPQYIAKNFVFPSELTPPELFEKYATKLLEELKTQEALQLKRKREEADTLATSSRPRRP